MIKYITACFYTIALIFNIIYYGLIIKFPSGQILEIILMTGHIFFMIYWIVVLWKLDGIDKKFKIGYTVGLIFITFIFAPLLGFKIKKDGSI